MASGNLNHGPALVVWRIRACTRRVPIPTGKHPRQPCDVTERVCFLLLPTRQGRCPIHIELEQADGKKLHDLAGIVLIGQRTGSGVVFDIATKREELPHGGTGGNLLEQCPVVSKCVVL